MKGQQVIDRIDFAERWLDRAKQQCQDGDVPRGLLTLSLANAEMTHALRAAQPVVPRRRIGFPSVLGIAAALTLACVALATSGVPGKFALANFWGGSSGGEGWQLGTPAPESGAEGATIVTLGGRVGSLLEFAAASPHQNVAPASPSPAKTQPRSVRRQRSLPRVRPATANPSVAVSKSAIMVMPPAPRVSVPVAGSSAQEQATIESGPSDVELINLVLAAERTLRTQSRP